MENWWANMIYCRQETALFVIVIYLSHQHNGSHTFIFETTLSKQLLFQMPYMQQQF